MRTALRSPEVVFPSKVDRWVVVVLALSAGGGVFGVVAAESPAEGLMAGVILLAAGLLVAALSVPTRYTVAGEDLIIRSGLMQQRIPLRAIHRVYPTRNPLAGPAWSLDRLGIDHDRGRMRSLALVSPARRTEFVALLAERAGLERRGEELRRPG